MKRFLTVAAVMLALAGRGQVAMLALEELDNSDLVCVTNYGPYVVGLLAGTNRWNAAASTNALQTARIAGLESRTNEWNTAYGWGDHAGLYRAIDWVPTVADVTGLQTALDGKISPAGVSNIVAVATNGFVTASITNGLGAGGVSASQATNIAQGSVTLAHAAANGGFAGTETIAGPALMVFDEGENGTMTVGASGIGVSNDEGDYGSLTAASGLSVVTADGAQGWNIFSTNLVYYTGDGAEVARWIFARTNGTYTAASTADITAHNADATAHAARFDPTVINVATASVITVTAGDYYINLTDWSATNSTWISGIEWDVTPELTVTGRYEFAFAECGAGLRGRMTWPQCCPWVPTLVTTRNTGTALYDFTDFVAAADTSAWIHVSFPIERGAGFLRVPVTFASLGAAHPQLTIVAAAYRQQSGGIVTAGYPTALLPTNALSTTISLTIPAPPDATQQYSLRLTAYRSAAASGTARVGRGMWRPLNKLERDAYGL